MKLPSEDLLNALERRYAPVEVPPCRVCGAELGIASMGGGAATKWACGDRPQVAGEMDAWYDHYRDSYWVQTQYGDADVRALVELARQMVRATVTQFALDDEYNPPHPLGYYDLQDYEWLQDRVKRGLKLVKREQTTLQTAWQPAELSELLTGDE